MYLAMNGGNVEKANKGHTLYRIPFVEFSIPAPKVSHMIIRHPAGNVKSTKYSFIFQRFFDVESTLKLRVRRQLTLSISTWFFFRRRKNVEKALKNRRRIFDLPAGQRSVVCFSMFRLSPCQLNYATQSSTLTTIKVIAM